ARWPTLPSRLPRWPRGRPTCRATRRRRRRGQRTCRTTPPRPPAPPSKWPPTSTASARRRARVPAVPPASTSRPASWNGLPPTWPRGLASSAWRNDMKEPARLLLVDDSRIFRAALEEALHGLDDMVVCDSVWSGEKALESIRSKPPDLVTLDVEMPGMDG